MYTLFYILIYIYSVFVGRPPIELRPSRSLAHVRTLLRGASSSSAVADLARGGGVKPSATPADGRVLAPLRPARTPMMDEEGGKGSRRRRTHVVVVPPRAVRARRIPLWPPDTIIIFIHRYRVTGHDNNDNASDP